MSIRNKLVMSALVCGLGTAAIGVSTPARASGAGAFIGGLVAANVLGNMQRRTEAQEEMAARPVPRHRTTHTTHKSADSRIKELNKLKADGDITEEEYQKKKQSIINGL
jgi:hypothetical protein